MADDDTAHIHVKVDPAQKTKWEKYLSESPEYNSLSSLIRVSVSKQISDEFDETEEQMDEIIDQISQMHGRLETNNIRLGKIRGDILTHGEMEELLDETIERIEDIHG